MTRFDPSTRAVSPRPSSKVEHDDEIEKLERQAEALRYKNAMHVAARTGLPLPAPGKIVNSSMAALVGTRKLAQKCV